MKERKHDTRLDVAQVEAAAAVNLLALGHGIAHEAAEQIMALPSPVDVAAVLRILIAHHNGALHIIARAGGIVSELTRARRERHAR